MKIVGAFEILDHGIEHSQYFQGCGVSHTPYTDVATGIGDTPGEALDDALEQLAQNDWDVEPVERSDDAKPFKVSIAYAHNDCDLRDHDDCELHYHVSVHVRPSDCAGPGIETKERT